MEDCAAANVTTALVITSGFAETGEEGRARQDRVAGIAREAGIRMVGPKLFRRDQRQERAQRVDRARCSGARRISLITQSGAYGMAAFTHSKHSAIGFAKVASPGNKADITDVDLLQVLRRGRRNKRYRHAAGILP